MRNPLFLNPGAWRKASPPLYILLQSAIPRIGRREKVRTRLA
ncbi:hypothetical protein AtDm6_1895 [Acetobacter tropicalis]|uniref:Uncharacterized protein n=2 Tax=Acetobacter tropicalis TaxID=104102 RepID=F7VGY3_9PROT|nr:hypothetical protein AtDm6_1895 [Acetobacter tropicalis]GAA09628.1 hypothetical protein ATPR_2632 [Acetobacter tropicalis NBRC 101654]